jgi:hypothetical protein
MFEEVGRRSVDLPERRRRAVAVLIVSLGAACLVGGLLAAGMWTVRASPAVLGKTIELIELSLGEDPVPSAPKVPRGVPEAGGGRAGPAHSDRRQPEEPAHEPPVEATGREGETEPEASPSAGEGPPGEGVEGEGEGVVGLGDTGGCEGSACGGSGGPRFVHHADLEVRRRVQLVFPVAAKGMGLAEQRCKATVRLDLRGVPLSVTVEKCPPLFHDSVREALLGWRWYPPRVGDYQGEVETVIVVRFRES